MGFSTSQKDSRLRNIQMIQDKKNTSPSIVLIKTETKTMQFEFLRALFETAFCLHSFSYWFC
jgi:hypothetical protein